MAVGGRTQAYSAGNKVYGSGRSNPTSGPVDPAGYVERSSNKKASNRRSGLAAAAGRRLESALPSALMNSGGAPPVAAPVTAQPSTHAPITLTDGRKVIATPTGQYVFLPEELSNGLD